MKRICVFCGASDGAKSIYRETAIALGQLLAERQIDLVYGGGNMGLMGIVADATLEAGGRVLGVTVRALADREQAHTELNELFIVNTMHERKTMMATLADGFIALPGGFGTLEEFIEILTWGQLGFHKKPAGLLNVEGFYNGLLSFFDQQVEQGFIQPSNRKLILTADTPAAMLEVLGNYVPVNVAQVLEQKDL
jgi:uncharacterized protein (TIGR00730 family)